MKKVICIILMIFLLSTNGCIMKKEENTVSNDYIVYNLNKFPRDLILLNDNELREKDILLALFEGLVREERNGDIVPGIAETWSVSKDKLGYIFKLRKDAYWSDGQEIRASDFVNLFYNFLSCKDNIYASELDCIYGAKDFREGKCDFEKVAITDVDEKTFQIRLNYPSAYFLNILSEPIFTLRDIESMNNWEKNYNNIKFSGPFRIKEITSLKDILITKNDKYWRSNDIRSSNILITAVEEPEKALAKFETNNINSIDILIDPPISEQMRLSEEGRLISIRNQTIYALCFNFKKNSIVNDVNIRRAINLSISKEHIIQSISKDLATPAVAYIPKGSEKEDDSGKKYFDVYGNRYKAKEFLEKSNYDKKDKITLVYENNPLNNRICEALTENLKEYLDISIITKSCEKEELDKLIGEGKFDIIQSQYSGDYDEESNFLKNCISNSNRYMYGYENLKLDNLIYNSEMEQNKYKKKLLENEAQQILKDELPVIPIYYMNTVICKKNNITGIYTTKKGNIKFDYVYRTKNLEK